MFTRGGRMPLSAWRALLFIPIWLACAGWLIQWWIIMAPRHHFWLYLVLSLALFYESVLVPATLLFLSSRAKLPPSRLRPRTNKKVAVITLCVPAAESMEIIERQLRAMRDINYPHDSWILDEGNSLKIKALAKKYGVKHFSRKGVAKYNQPVFPFQAGTKAGNVNAWLDRTKRYRYEFFVQLDIDHMPDPAYLDRKLGHFRDPAVAWVQSPSVYNNLEFWTARGSAEQEMGMHGPIQMGLYGLSNTPLIVGSHAAYRTQAIHEIGGFQPTRAEDQLNTLVLASNGWRGVFVPEVLATGHGPETLSSYLTQQYAWARSVIHLIKGYTWRYIAKLRPAQRWQFVFLQSWYPLSALSFWVLYLVPIVSLVFNWHLLDVSAASFLVRFVPYLLASVSLFLICKPLMQPHDLRLSWRGSLLHFIRWPVISVAMIGAITNRQKPYQVTPKGKFLSLAPTTQLYRPFLVLGGISLGSIIFASDVYGRQASKGQVLFALYDATAMLSVCLIDLNLRLRQAKLWLWSGLQWLRPVAAVAVMIIITGLAVTNSMVLPQKSTAALLAAKLATNQAADSLPVADLNAIQLRQEISSPKYKLSRNVAPIGFYNPDVQVNARMPYLRSIFVDWQQNWQLEQELVRTNRLNAEAVVTIEPKGDNNGARLLGDIAAGRYDSRLMVLFSTIRLDPNTVYVRFAHEMDLPNSFVWGAQDPSLFVAAYRHVIDLARSHQVNNVKWVWSPAGIQGAEAYYPGDQYVDVIGTTMLYAPYWSGTYKPSFNEIQSARSWLFQYNKPVWITEFGAANDDPAFQSQLISAALSQYLSDGYQALIYMDIKEPNLVNGPDYHLPSLDALSSIFKPTLSMQPMYSSALPSVVKMQNLRPYIYPGLDLPPALRAQTFPAPSSQPKRARPVAARPPDTLPAPALPRFLEVKHPLGR